MIRMKFSQVTVGDVVINGHGHEVEIKYIQTINDGHIVLSENVIYKWGGMALGWPNDYIDVVNRCEVCCQRTLAHTGECMSPVCHGLSEMPDDHAAQMEWVKAARQFKAAVRKMFELWHELDDRAKSVETPDEYPFDEAFDEGPLHSILGWLNEEKLNAIEQRAKVMGKCPSCDKGQLIRTIPPTKITLCHRGADVGVDGRLTATCTDCHITIIAE